MKLKPFIEPKLQVLQEKYITFPDSVDPFECSSLENLTRIALSTPNMTVVICKETDVYKQSLDSPYLCCGWSSPRPCMGIVNLVLSYLFFERSLGAVGLQHTATYPPVGKNSNRIIIRLDARWLSAGVGGGGRCGNVQNYRRGNCFFLGRIQLRLQFLRIYLFFSSGSPCFFFFCFYLSLQLFLYSNTSTFLCFISFSVKIVLKLRLSSAFGFIVFGDFRRFEVIFHSCAVLLSKPLI